ncbi:hypothetical protein KR093_005199, partial [Drosophila rubida]
NCQELKELESTCGNYCFKAMKPVLDHTKYLQSQVNHQMESLTEPEHLRKLVDVWIEHKLENLRSETEATLLKQFKLQDDKLDKKLQALLAQVQEARSPYQKIGSKYYYIEHSNALNWFGAVNKCLQMNGHLVTIESLDEFNAIKKNLQAARDYWIDINDLARESEFTSIVTGRRATYLNWGAGEPSNLNNNEQCGELYGAINHLMNDDTCTEKQLFICEHND